MTHIDTDLYALNIENFSDSLKNFIHVRCNYAKVDLIFFKKFS